MNEPPIRPEDQRADSRSAAPSEFENPYAPAATAPTVRITQIPNLPLEYWGILFLAFCGFAMLSYVAPGLGVPAILALVSAAIRVPLLQRRLPNMSTIDRPSPYVVLLTSWGFSLVIGAASLIAFCMICIPAGFVAISLGANNGRGVGLAIVFGLCGIIALFVYVLLFWQSLKMHV